MNKPSSTYVTILDKEYQVACPEDEKAALGRAAQELDQRMRAIRSSGATLGLERMAVMVALNLCHELQQSHKGTAKEDPEFLKRIAKKLDDALQAG